MVETLSTLVKNLTSHEQVFHPLVCVPRHLFQGKFILAAFCFCSSMVSMVHFQIWHMLVGLMVILWTESGLIHVKLDSTSTFNPICTLDTLSPPLIYAIDLDDPKKLRILNYHVSLLC